MSDSLFSQGMLHTPNIMQAIKPGEYMISARKMYGSMINSICGKTLSDQCPYVFTVLWYCQSQTFQIHKLFLNIKHHVFLKGNEYFFFSAANPCITYCTKEIFFFMKGRHWKLLLKASNHTSDNTRMALKLQNLTTLT